MSKSVASESKGDNKTPKQSRKCGSDDEEDENESGISEGSLMENSRTLTTVSAAHVATDQFMHTPEFRRHFVDFVPVDALMALKVAMKGWNAAVDALIDEGVESGEIIVHDGGDISYKAAQARNERRKLVTQVIFLLNIPNVGDHACRWANLVVVDIPEGVERIGDYAFQFCRSLTTVSFPTTLKKIGGSAFENCTSLENVDLLHTNLKELGDFAFYECRELKSMTIPDSLQTLDTFIFYGCSKLGVPNNPGPHLDNNEVITYLRSLQNNRLKTI